MPTKKNYDETEKLEAYNGKVKLESQKHVIVPTELRPVIQL